MPQIVRIEVKGNFQWGAWIDPASKSWIAECPPLDLVAEGETWAELQEMMADITGALMLDLFREQRLGDFLRDKGWTLSQPMPAPEEQVTFDVPLPVVRAVGITA